MYGAVVTILACAVAVSEGFEVIAGPITTTQEVGSKFTLRCTIADQNPDTDTVFWNRYSVSSPDPTEPERLTFDRKSLNRPYYEVVPNTYNLIVKNATYLDDARFECLAGTSKKFTRVYIYDKPETMSLDWEHTVNRPGAVKANQEYKLRCTTKHSHPPATHRYFKNGVELSNTKISYSFRNDTDYEIGYGDVTSTLPFTPNNEDVGSMKTVRCVADLYNKKNVSSIAFGINSATRSSSIGFGAALVVLMGVLLRE